MLILQVIYFLLPGYFANMAAVASSLIPWKTPIFPTRLKFRGKPILGENKTWRGAIFGIIIGFGVFLIQKYLFDNAIYSEIAYFDYNSYWLGFLLSFGAIFGDLFESFIKRQVGIKPGMPFIPWDQLDHVVFALLFAGIIVNYNFEFVVWAIIITFVGHILTNFLGYALKLRKTKW